jgi:hypothetical protein
VARTARRTAPASLTTQTPPPDPEVQEPRLKVEVEWANIVKATGDVFVVGHYIGVLPQNAEWALDCAISGVTSKSGSVRGVDDGRLILTDLTRRGAIRGALGDIIFFPWSDRGQVVLAGMGRMGTFKEPQLEQLAANLTQCVGRLLPKPTICSVLIGAGYGNLKVTDAVSAMVTGVARTLAADSTIPAMTLRLVEYRLDRAYEVLAALRKTALDVAAKSNVAIVVGDEVSGRDENGGAIPIPFGFSLMMASLAQACYRKSGPLAPSVDALVNELPEMLRPGVLKALETLGEQKNTRQLGLAFRMVEDDGRQETIIADRISFSHDGVRIQAAAITNLTTVAARTLEVSSSWIDRIVETLRAPSESVFVDRGRRAFRSLVHPELRDKLLLPTPLVLELDRTMARLSWELVHNDEDPLAVLRPVARQLRTSYSPRASGVVTRSTWKALIIGDPDGSLPAARAEAETVKKVLSDCGLTVDVRMGPPDALGLGPQLGDEPADLYEILELLQSGDYDVVHFAGHAFFNPQYPDRSGWYFKDDILTASKLEGVERVPRLIVANACISAALSSTLATRPSVGAAAATPATTGSSDSGLVASLADEFFRRGVADYIGTAWEVPELPAKLFAELFYKEFFTGWKDGNRPDGAPPTSLGVAIQRARAELFRRRTEFAPFQTVWAAYQHYGDPTRTLTDYRS